jgi:amyloid beta (A4) precursor protein-binding family B protein 2 (Fe65-like)
MGVNEPLLFLSPDDQVNNNSTVSPPDEEPYPVRPVRVPFLSETLLPPGWERHEDTSGPYYWHIKSGTIQRDRPTSEQRLEASANPALLIPGTLNSTPLNSSGFRRSQTISSQLSSSFSANGSTPTKIRNTDGDVLRREKGEGDIDRAEKRRSWSQFLPEDEPRIEEKNSFRFGGVSLGSLSISEENLTPERSSRAVSKVIAELTTQGTGKGISPPG